MENKSLMHLAHYLFLKICSRRSESFSQATYFSAHLPNFNPAMPKFNSFARNSETSQSKNLIINSVPNTSEIMYLYGFFDDPSKTLSKFLLDQACLMTSLKSIIYSFSILLSKQVVECIWHHFSESSDIFMCNVSKHFHNIWVQIDTYVSGRCPCGNRHLLNDLSLVYNTQLYLLVSSLHLIIV